MKNFETKFIEESIKQSPFIKSDAMKGSAQAFINNWTRANSVIATIFIKSKECENEERKGVLKEVEADTKVFFLPEDLHLWEMSNAIVTFDGNPNRIKELGNAFENAGLYLSSYLPALDDNEDAKQIAENMALQFYQYGLSLQNEGERNDELPEASKGLLSPTQKSQIDEWLLGEDVYEKRLAKLGENPSEEEKEELRKELIKAYFTALSRKGYEEEGEKVWETKIGVMRKVHERARKQIKNVIETPITELNTAVFRKGKEKLMAEARLGLSREGQRIYEALDIDGLKEELEALRKSGDIEAISARELEIAKGINEMITRLPYKEDINKPSHILKDGSINCLGSSLLGGAFLDELDIKYLFAYLDEHASTVLITSDKKAYWQDFTSGELDDNFKEITPDMIKGGTCISDIVDNLDENGFSIKFKDWNPYSYIEGQLRIKLFESELGLELDALYNRGADLSIDARDKEAIKTYREAIRISTGHEGVYNNMGSALMIIEQYEEAVEAFRKAIELNPEKALYYENIGLAFANLKEHEKALEAFEEARRINPVNPDYYFNIGFSLEYLSKYEEAVEAFKQSITLYGEESIDRKKVSIYYHLGFSLNSLGRYKERDEVTEEMKKLASLILKKEASLRKFPKIFF